MLADSVLIPLAQAKEAETLWQNRQAKQPQQLAALPSNTFPPLFSAAKTDVSTYVEKLRRRSENDIPASLARVLGALPVRATTVRSIEKGNSDWSVIVMQDVHLNEQAERNIVEVVTAAARAMPSLIVGVEGAFERFDLGRFKSSLPEPVRASVAAYFLKEQRIGVPGYFGIQGNLTPTFIGVDDKASHERNVQAYRDSLEGKPAIEKKLQTVRENLEKRKKKTLSAWPAKYDHAVESFRSGELDFVAFAKWLDAERKTQKERPMKIPPTPTLDRFLRAVLIEKEIDFPRVERERNDLFRQLSARMDAAGMERLLSTTMAYGREQLTHQDYYTELTRVLRANGLSIEKATAFQTYLTYLSIADGISGDALMSDLRDLDRTLITVLPLNKREKELLESSQAASLTDRLIRFSLMPSEWKDFQSLQNRRRDLIPFSDDELRPFVAFYKEADLRSEAMARNLVQAGRSKKDQVALLISGGFHTPELLQALRRQGASIAVIQPKLQNVSLEKGNAYLSVFTRDKSPLERYLFRERLFLAPTLSRHGTYGPANVVRVLVTLIALLGSPEPHFRASMPEPAAVVKKIDFADEKTSALYTTGEAPRGYKELETISVPGQTPVRLVREAGFRRLAKEAAAFSEDLFSRSVKRPLIEFWFPAVAFAGILLLGISSHWGILLSLGNATVFALLHAWWKGRLSGSSMIGRTAGAFLILEGARLLTSLVFPYAFGWDAMLVYLTLTIAGHSLWNAVMPEEWHLSLKPDPKKPAGSGPKPDLRVDPRSRVAEAAAGEVAAIKSNPSFLKVLDGKPLSRQENLALQFYVAKLAGVTFKGTLPAIYMSPRLLEAVQAYEMSSLQSRVSALGKTALAAQIDAEITVTQKRLGFLGQVYRQSNLPELNNDNQNSWLMDNGSQDPGYVFFETKIKTHGAFYEIQLWITETENERRAIASRFNQAERDNDFGGMLKAVGEMGALFPNDPEPAQKLRDRLDAAVNGVIDDPDATKGDLLKLIPGLSPVSAALDEVHRRLRAIKVANDALNEIKNWSDLPMFDFEMSLFETLAHLPDASVLRAQVVAALVALGMDALSKAPSFKAAVEIAETLAPLADLAQRGAINKRLVALAGREVMTAQEESDITDLMIAALTGVAKTVAENRRVALRRAAMQLPGMQKKMRAAILGKKIQLNTPADLLNNIGRIMLETANELLHVANKKPQDADARRRRKELEADLKQQTDVASAWGFLTYLKSANPVLRKVLVNHNDSPTADDEPLDEPDEPEPAPQPQRPLRAWEAPLEEPEEETNPAAQPAPQTPATHPPAATPPTANPAVSAPAAPGPTRWQKARSALNKTWKKWRTAAAILVLSLGIAWVGHWMWQAFKSPSFPRNAVPAAATQSGTATPVLASPVKRPDFIKSLGASFVEDWAPLSSAQWSLLRVDMREKAEKFTREQKTPVELCDIPRDRLGIPLLLADQDGKPIAPNAEVDPLDLHLLYDDGRTEKIYEEGMINGLRQPVLRSEVFDPVSRTFKAAPGREGRRFRALRLDPEQKKPYHDAAGNRLRDMYGQPIPDTGFRVLDGNVVSSRYTHWRTTEGTEMVVGREGLHLQAIHPKTRQEVLLQPSLEWAQGQVARTEKNRDSLKRRVTLLSDMLTDKQNTAYLVNDKNEVVKKFLRLQDIPQNKEGKPDLTFWKVGAKGELEIFDKRLDPDRVPAKMTLGAKGDEVIFTVQGENIAKAAQRAERQAVLDSVGTRATTAWSAWTTTPVYMVVLEKDGVFPDGTPRPGRLVLALRTPAEARHWLEMKLGVKVGSARVALMRGQLDRLSTRLNNAPPNSPLRAQLQLQFNVLEQDYIALQKSLLGPQAVVGSLTNDSNFTAVSRTDAGDYVVVTNDDPSFEQVWMRMADQKASSSYVMAMNPEGTGEAVIDEKEWPKVDGLNWNPKDASGVFGARRIVRGPHEGKYLMTVQVMLKGRRNGTAKPLLVTERQLTDLKEKLYVDVEVGKNKIRLVRTALGYRSDSEGRVTKIFDSAEELHQELRRADLIYELDHPVKVNGRMTNRCLYHELPPTIKMLGIQVIRVINPADGSTIHTGTEWTKLGILMDTAVQSSNPTAPAVIVMGTKRLPITIKDGHGTDQLLGFRTILTGASSNAVSGNTEMVWMTAVAAKAEEVEAARNAGNMPLFLTRLEELRRMRDGRTTMPAPGVGQIIIKGTLGDRLAGQANDVANLRRTAVLEYMKTSGGGVLTVPGAEQSDKVRGLEERRLDLWEDWRTAKRLGNDKRCAQIERDIEALGRDIRKEQIALEKTLNAFWTEQRKAVAESREVHPDTPLITFFRGDQEKIDVEIAALGNYQKKLLAKVKAAPNAAARERELGVLNRSIRENSYVLDGHRYFVSFPVTEAAKERKKAEARFAEQKKMMEDELAVLQGKKVVLKNGTEIEGALTVVVAYDPRIKGADAVRQRLAPIHEGEKKREERLSELNRQLVDDPLPEQRARVLAEMQRIEDQNVITWEEDGVHYTMMLRYGEKRANASVARARDTLKAAQELEKTKGTSFWEIPDDGTPAALVSEPGRVRGLITDLSVATARANKRYQELSASAKAEDRALVPQALADLQELEGGVLRKDGKRYVARFGIDDAAKVRARAANLYGRSYTPGKRYLALDQNGRVIGSLSVNGNHVHETRARIVDTDPSGLFLVELRTNIGRAKDDGVEMRLVDVKRQWFNQDEQVVGEISGTLSPTGDWQPRFFTVNAYPNQTADRPDLSRTFPYDASKTLRDHAGLTRDLSSSRSLTVQERAELETLVRRYVEPWMQFDAIPNVYQLTSPMGRIWWEAKDKTGRLIFEIECIRSGDRVTPVRIIKNSFDESELSLARIPVASTVFDAQTHRRIGWSRLRSSYADYVRTGEIKYERHLDTLHERIWETKDSAGRLIWKTVLKESARGAGDWTPYNSTYFSYRYGPNDHGIYGLADEAYTFEVKPDGTVKGSFVVRPDGTVAGDYFEFTQVVSVDRSTQEMRALYRVHVRDESRRRNFEQYGEVKNGNGDLLQRSVVHEAAEEITFFDNSLEPNGWIRQGVSHHARTFYVTTHHRNGGGKAFDMASLDLANGTRITAYAKNGQVHSVLTYDRTRGVFTDGRGVRYTPTDVALIPLNDSIGRIAIVDTAGTLVYGLTLKDSSRVDRIDEEGALHFNRTVFIHQGGQCLPGGTYRDVIRRGLWVRSRNVETGEETEIVYDGKKLALSGTKSDTSAHPSRDGKTPIQPRVLEKVDRENQQFGSNPYLPDLGERHWRQFTGKSLAADGAASPIELWNDVYGREVVRLREANDGKTGGLRSVSVQVSDRDPMKMTEWKNPRRPVTLSMAAREKNQPFVDMSSTDFLYFRVDTLGAEGRSVGPLTARFTDTSGNTVVVGHGPDAQMNFWMPDSQKRLLIRDLKGNVVASVQLVAETTSLDKQNSPDSNRGFVFAVPVSHLKQLGLRVNSMRPTVTVESSNENEPLLVSEVCRAGRRTTQRSPDEIADFDKDKKDSSQRRVVPGSSGQTMVHDATADNKEGSSIQIRGPNNKLLGVVRFYRYGSSRSNITLEQPRLVVFDESGTYPIGSFGMTRTRDGKYHLNRGDVILFTVRERGNEIDVYEVNPVTNPRTPMKTTYRRDALDPSKPVNTVAGDLVSYDGGDSGTRAKAANRVGNSLFNLPWRWLRGEKVGIDETAPKATAQDLHKGLARIDLDAVQGQLPRMVNVIHENLPEKERPATAALIPEFSLAKIGTWPGALWGLMALFPLWLGILASYTSSRFRQFQQLMLWRKEAHGDRRFTLFDQDLVLEALTRFNQNVIQTRVRVWRDGMPVLVASDGNIEGAFLGNLFVIYLLVFAWSRKHIKNDVDAEDMRQEMDIFARAISRYLTEEIGRGADLNVARYTLKGEFDVQLWSKLEIYLSQYRDGLRAALVEKVQSDARDPGDPPPAAAPKPFQEVFDGMLRDSLLMTPQGEFSFDDSTMKKFIADNRFAEVPAVFIIAGRYLPKILSVLFGILLFGGDKTSFGVIPPVLIWILVAVTLLTIAVNVFIEVPAIRAGKVAPENARRARAALTFLSFAGFLALAVTLPINEMSFSMFMICLIGVFFMGMELLGFLLPRKMWWGGNRSMFGVSWAYHVSWAHSLGRARAIFMIGLIHVIFMAAAIALGVTVIPFFFDFFATGRLWAMAVAGFIFILGLPLLHHGINLWVRFFFSLLSPTFGAKGGKRNDARTVGVAHLGGETMASPAVNKPNVNTRDLAKTFVSNLTEMMGKDPAGKAAFMTLLRRARQDPRLSGVPAGDWKESNIPNLVQSWLEQLFDAERAADQGQGITLWTLRQMYDPAVPRELQVGQTLTPLQQACIEHGWRIMRSIDELTGLNFNSMDTAISYVEMAETLGDEGMAEQMIFFMGSNQYNDHQNAGKNPLTMDISQNTETGQRMKLALLLGHVSRRAGRPGVQAYVATTHTVFGLKSAGMHELLMVPSEMPTMEGILITDRNSKMLNVRKFVRRDVRRFLDNPNIAVMVAQRNTTYTIDALGATSFAIEGGHGQSMMSLNDMIGTGWFETQRNTFFEMMKETGDPETAFRSFLESQSAMTRATGVIPFSPNAIGISEDYWGVLQQFYSMISLGYTPEVALTESIAHKVREKKTLAEWKAAPPRWSAGLVQSMEAILNQQVNEFGPHSYFEKEARQTNADHYLLGPLILLNIILIPISIWLGLSPFVGVNLLLFFPGILLNQATTGNSFLALSRHMGFFPGLAKWIQARIPDAMLFSSRTVRDSLAQFSGHQGLSLEFKMSGGAAGSVWTAIFPFWLKDTKRDGARAVVFRDGLVLSETVVQDGPDKGKTRQVVLGWTGRQSRLLDPKVPAEKDLIAGTGLLQTTLEVYSFFNTFMFGMALIGLNCFVLVCYLDSMNAVMMILSLWFAFGVAFGPMLYDEKRGKTIGGGFGDLVGKLFGFALGALLLVGVAGVTAAALKLSLDMSLMYGLPIIAAVILFYRLVMVRAGRYAQRANKPKLERFASEWQRGFWTAILLFGIFAFVPMPPTIAFDLGPWPLQFTPVQFLSNFAGPALLVVIAILILGKLTGWRALRRVQARYKRLTQLQALRGGDGDTGANAAGEGISAQVITFIQQEAYAFAQEAMNWWEDALMYRRPQEEDPEPPMPDDEDELVNQTQRHLASVNEARGEKEEDAVLTALQKMAGMRSLDLGLEDFGLAADPQKTFNNSFIDWIYLTWLANTQRDARELGRADGMFSQADGLTHTAFISRAKTFDELKMEVNAMANLVGKRDNVRVTFVLQGPLAKRVADINKAVRDPRFRFENGASINSVDDAANKLVIFDGQQPATFKVVRHRDTVIPKNVEKALSQLARDTRFRSIRLLMTVLASLLPNGAAMEVALDQLNNITRFRRRALNQA